MQSLPDISAGSFTIFWFRRDLRLVDNTGLYHALESHQNVLPIFILDTEILNKLEDKDDKRITFIFNHLRLIENELNLAGSSLLVLHGKPFDVFVELLKKYKITAVYSNEDYEPYAIKRDIEIAGLLTTHQIGFRQFKDQVIFAKNDVVKDDGKPYTVFTPYSKVWKNRLTTTNIQIHHPDRFYSNLLKIKPFSHPTIEQTGFESGNYIYPSSEVDDNRIVNYSETRDLPFIEGTTRLSLHLRFGTISIRQLVLRAKHLNVTYLNELIWREFYMMILWHFPNVVGNAFKPAYDRIKWVNDEKQFEAWTHGKTGIPLVDAGMRQLMLTGFMHNRVRMVVASFLTKNLLIDWRWGEAWFARKLLDFELASNNGGWQWAAGTGCDAAPYFRVFNPVLQAEKFDPQHDYIKKWVPEWSTSSYPKPIVDLKISREQAIKVYKQALSET